MQKLFSLDGRLVKTLTRFTDIIILNTLFIVCCLPILTIGASLTALATMWHRLLKGEDSDLVFHFFRSISLITEKVILYRRLGNLNLFFIWITVFFQIQPS